MAEKRATFSLRRRTALGFSYCRRLRIFLSVPSRSTFFFSRRKARSTGSPFFSLISVIALTSFPGRVKTCHGAVPAKFRESKHRFFMRKVNELKRRNGLILRRQFFILPPAWAFPNFVRRSTSWTH